MERRIRIAAHILITALFLQSGGCSIIGFTAGSLIDADKPAEVSCLPQDLTYDDIGRDMKIIRIDSTVAVGKFRGMKKLTSPDSGTVTVILEQAEEPGSNTISIPSDQIRELKIPQNYSWKWILLGIGLAVDGGTGFLIIKLLRDARESM